MVTTIATGMFRAKGLDICALKMPLPALDAGADRCWVQVIPGEGSFAGLSDGETIEFNEETIDAFVANAMKKRTPIQFDYNHQGLDDDRVGLVPSSGHILNVEKRMGDTGAELWVDVEWTAKAAQAIKDKEVLFCSPAFVMQYPDKETGKDQGPTLLSVALTDMPFLEGQKPIQMSEFAFRRAGRSVFKLDQKQAIKLDVMAALQRVMSRVTEDMSDFQVQDMVWEELQAEHEREVVRDVLEEAGMLSGDAEAKTMAEETEDKLKEMQEGSEKEQEDPPEEPPAEEKPPMQAEEGPNATAFLEAVSSAAGMDPDMALSALMEDENMNKVAALLNARADQEARAMSDDQRRWNKLEEKAKDAKILKMSARIEALEKGEQKRKQEVIEAEADKLIADGYALDEDRDDVIWALSENPERARRMYARKVVPQPADTAPEVNGKNIVKLGDQVVQLSEAEQHQLRWHMQARLYGGDRDKCIKHIVDARN